MKKRIVSFILIALTVFSFMPILADETGDYERYVRAIENVKSESDITSGGFRIMEAQRYPVIHKELGVIELIPSIYGKYGRVVLFFKDNSGNIVFKTDNLESNSWMPGRMEQPNADVITVAFRDLNGDGLDDILIICSCVNQEGDYVGKPYNVGDVLFQNELGFYRDWRISDKIARFDMNKDIDAITAFVRDGKSMEFLYIAQTLGELLSDGYQVISDHSFGEYFEMLGVVQVVSGFYDLNGQCYLIVYILNENGKIIWNFQPMGDYVNFYSIRGISFTDIEGDGLKDVVLLANYVTYNEEGEGEIKADYNIYYQRAGYFIEDTEIKDFYPCADDDNLGSITQAAKRYWRRVD